MEQLIWDWLLPVIEKYILVLMPMMIQLPALNL